MFVIVDQITLFHSAAKAYFNHFIVYCIGYVAVFVEVHVLFPMVDVHLILV